MSVDQLDLFGDRPGLVRADHPDTSRLAAEQIEPRTGTLRRRVLDEIRRTGGATDEQIQTALGMAGNTERPRRVELVDAELVVDSGERRRIHGRLAIVWQAAR